MKIVIADDLPASAVALLASVPGWTVDARAGRPRSALLAAVADADALVVRSATKVDRELLSAGARLRAVARAGTGVDNVDLDEASRRGIVVMNTPGANSVSVAEHTFALLLAVSRAVAAGDAAMKQERWEKKALTGAELRGKVLGIVGLGRIGQEVARRARAFDMKIVGHDPYLPTHLATDLGVSLVNLDALCECADYITLHLPSTDATRGLFDGARFARCKRGVRLINTARGELIDEAALADAIESGQVAGAGLDVFRVEPLADWRLAKSPRVVATPHIAASTTEAQELVGIEVAESLRDFLAEGVVRNAVNFPSVSPEEFKRLTPFLDLGERLGALLAQLAPTPVNTVGLRYYGQLGEGSTDLVASAVLTGVLRPALSEGVSLVNARQLAAERGLELVETRSSRPRAYTRLVSVKLHAGSGERWAEGTVPEHGQPRLVLLDGIEVDAPLEGTLIVIGNDDQPGVIGEVGTILGSHGVNIATFALGRDVHGAVGIVGIDRRQDGDAVTGAVLAELRGARGVRSVQLVRLPEARQAARLTPEEDAR